MDRDSDTFKTMLTYLRGGVKPAGQYGETERKEFAYFGIDVSEEFYAKKPWKLLITLSGRADTTGQVC